MAARTLLPILGTILMIAACGGSQSTVTVPPRQEFLLGENEAGGFTATLRNVGAEEVMVQTRSADGEQLSSFAFPAGDETSITVGAGQVAVFVNPNDAEATVRTSLSQDVAGMRYDATELPAPAATVDAVSLSAAVGTDWMGTLTYMDYSSGEETEIAAGLEVRQVGQDAFLVTYRYPDEPQANDTTMLEIGEGGRTLAGRPVLSAVQEGDAYVVRTSERTVDGDEEVVRFFTYRVSPTELVIRTDYQTLGSTELNFRNAYRFTR